MLDNEQDLIWMSMLVFVPSVFALVLAFFPKGTEEWMRWWTLAGTAVTLVVSLVIFIDYYREVYDYNLTIRAADPAQGSLTARAAEADNPTKAISGLDWVARRQWIPQFNIDYYLGIDGISMPLILLTTALFFLSMIASWNIERFVKGYCMLFLVLETGVLGTFVSLDFFLFYIFWEVMLLPMYFLIGVWGGPRREYAAIKFFLYTLLGSGLILIAIIAFYFTDVRDFAPPKSAAPPKAGVSEVRNSFDIMVLQKAGRAAAKYLNGTGTEDERARVALQDYANPDVKKDMPVAEARLKNQWFFNSPVFQVTMFLLLFIGFAIKVPVFPFHTWLPDAHVEAPTPISMILAGILLKLGGYGIIRIAYPICPFAAQHLAWWLALFGVINIVYGAFAAMAQVDFKKLVAYSSISHMGYVILGFAVWAAPERAQYWEWGMNGAMFQMIAHGITSAGMFFLVGVIYDRAHHRNLDNFRGLNEPMPLYGGISAIIFFAAMGLPGLCGFWGEVMVVLATWNYNIVFAILAALTVVLTAAYILWTVQRVYLGTNPAYKDFTDINLRELACVIPLVVLSILLGVMPVLLLNWMEPDVSHLANLLARLGASVPGP